MNLQRLREIKTKTWIALVISFYIGISYLRYRIVNPHLTETELALNVWQALTWQ